MRKLNYEKGLTIFVSDEIWKKYTTHRKGKKLVGLDINSHLDKCPPDLKRDIQTFSKKTGLSGITIIYAHGDVLDKKWMYRDREHLHSIQRWLNRQDGKYACLLCAVCNPGSCTPHTKHSLLLILSPIINTPRQDLDKVVFSLFHPDTTKD